MAEPYLGQVAVFGFNFAPVGWLQCNGQLLPISQYDALYSLLGTTFGGDGMSTFGLPDYRSRVGLGEGRALSGTTYYLGQMSGSESVTLTTPQLGAHNHAATAQYYGTSAAGDQPLPGGQVWAGSNSENVYVSNPTTTPMGATCSAILAPAGGSAPHDNIQPYLAVSYCIAYQGVYPSRP